MCLGTSVAWCHWVIQMTALYILLEMIFLYHNIIEVSKCHNSSTDWALNTHGLSNRSADPNTFFTEALLSKNFLSSHDVSTFLSWLLSCCPSGHGATTALVEWETGQVLHHVSFKLRRISSRIASFLDFFGSAWMNTPLQSFSIIMSSTFLTFWSLEHLILLMDRRAEKKTNQVFARRHW